MKEIGIDVVFSGHDHAYGRTAMLDGTTYFVCGTTGNKYYEAVNDGSFLVYNDEKEATYMTATINGNALTIKALRPDGRVIDIDTYVRNGDVASNDSNSATEGSVIQKVENASTGSTVHIPMGSGQKLFNSDGTITREQMAVMLSNYVKYKGTPLLPKGRTEAFSDETAISPWAVEAVAQMGQLGLMKGRERISSIPKRL